ncbi:unnamed protein product [Prunus armeniaca]
MHSPSEDNMNAVLRILRYLKSSTEKGLMFLKHGHLNIDGYLDADWVGSVIDRSSTSGYFTFVAAAIAIAQYPIQHDRTKHVAVDRHFIKQKVKAKMIQPPFVKSKDQLTDILTKAISSRAFHNSLEQLSMSDIYAPM